MPKSGGRIATAAAGAPGVGTRVAIALGSNIGDRAAHLDRAVTRLGRFISHIKYSSWFETAPVGESAGSRWFLNGALVGTTQVEPLALMQLLLLVEREAGRDRPFPGAPRTLDLDLVLYGDERIEESGLIVPHERFRERRFVLEPLAEIAGDWVDPVTGTSISALLRSLPDPS